MYARNAAAIRPSFVGDEPLEHSTSASEQPFIVSAPGASPPASPAPAPDRPRQSPPAPLPIVLLESPRTLPNVPCTPVQRRADGPQVLPRSQNDSQPTSWPHARRRLRSVLPSWHILPKYVRRHNCRHGLAGVH